MPLPLIPILIGIGISSLIGRKAHDKWGKHPPLKGYCSNCGETTQHAYHESGMSWKKTGVMGVLSGAVGLGVSSLVARNIYKCKSCQHLTLQCRVPRCKGMALAGEYYDDEFCGQCRTGNDQSKLYKAYQDQKTLAKVKEVMRAMQSEIETLKAKIRELEKERSKHKEIIRQLNELLDRKERELSDLRRQVA